MVLNIPAIPNLLFPHSNQYDQGMGKYRTGGNIIIVAQDGTGDTDNIEEAVKILGTAGGEIFIKQGTYQFKAAASLNSNTTITGSGWGTVIKGFISGTTPAFSASSKTNIQIRNLKFDYTAHFNITFTTCTYCIIEHCYCQSDGNDCISLTNCSNCTVKDCIIPYGNVTIGFLGTSNNCLAHGNTIINAGQLSIEGNYNVVSNNFFYKCTDAAVYTTGSYNNINGNQVVNAASGGSFGLWFDIGDKNSCIGNTLYGGAVAGTNGIQIEAGCDRTLVTGNLSLSWGTNINNLGSNTTLSGNLSA